MKYLNKMTATSALLFTYATLVTAQSSTTAASTPNIPKNSLVYDCEITISDLGVKSYSPITYDWKNVTGQDSLNLSKDGFAFVLHTNPYLESGEFYYNNITELSSKDKIIGYETVAAIEVPKSSESTAASISIFDKFDPNYSYKIRTSLQYKNQIVDFICNGKIF